MYSSQEPFTLVLLIWGLFGWRHTLFVLAWPITGLLLHSAHVRLVLHSILPAAVRAQQPSELSCVYLIRKFNPQPRLSLVHFKLMVILALAQVAHCSTGRIETNLVILVQTRILESQPLQTRVFLYCSQLYSNRRRIRDGVVLPIRQLCIQYCLDP